MQAAIEEHAHGRYAERGPGGGEGATCYRTIASQEKSLDGTIGDAGQLGGLDDRKTRIDRHDQSSAQEGLEWKLV
jgi:hypothetical protein